jgi:UDP-glucose 4-epimerase
MRIFLTGGTGFLGSHFLVAALESGHHVTALRRHGSEPRVALFEEPNWCYGDLNDNFSEHLNQCDVLVHLAAAGVVSNKDKWDCCFETNVSQSLALWRHAIDCGIKHFLICGSCFEYGMTGLNQKFISPEAPLLPTDAYSASKAAATMAAIGLANEFNLKLIVVRPFQLYGEGEAPTRFWPSLKRAALSGNNFAMTKGQQIRDFMRVEKAALALLELAYSLKHLRTNYALHNLGTGLPVTLLEFAQEQWQYFNAKGSLLPGSIPYRSNEVMRYAPMLPGLIADQEQ